MGKACGALKVLYLAVRSLDPKGTGQQRWITRWKPILNVLALSFHERIPETASLWLIAPPVTPFPGQSPPTGSTTNSKDAVESAAHAAVCKGTISLQAGKTGIATDWVAFGRRLGRALPAVR